MAILVEDGSGLAEAVSYATVEAADAYHSARGNTAWTGSAADKEAALIRATTYIDGVYRLRFLGHIAALTQALEWPRAYAWTSDRGVLPSNAIPRAVVHATCECALREIEAPGSLSPDVSPGEQIVSETVGPLSVDYDGSVASGSTGEVLPILVAVDRALAPVLRSSAGALLLRA